MYGRSDDAPFGVEPWFLQVPNGISAQAFCPGDRFVVVGDNKGRLFISDPESRTSNEVIAELDGCIRCIRFSKSADRLALVGDFPHAVVLCARTFHELSRMPSSSLFLNSCDWDYTGRLHTGGADGKLRTWSQDGSLSDVVAFGKPVLSLCVDSNDRVHATSYDGRALCIENRILSERKVLDGPLWGVRVTDDGYVLTGRDDGLIDMSGITLQHVRHRGAIVAIHDLGDDLYGSFSHDGSLQLWSLSKMVACLGPIYPGWTYSSAYSAGRRSLCVVGSSGTTSHLCRVEEVIRQELRSPEWRSDPQTARQTRIKQLNAEGRVLAAADFRTFHPLDDTGIMDAEIRQLCIGGPTVNVERWRSYALVWDRRAFTDETGTVLALPPLSGSFTLPPDMICSLKIGTRTFMEQRVAVALLQLGLFGQIVWTGSAFVLSSAEATLSIARVENDLVFTGTLGAVLSPIILSIDAIVGAEKMVCETTYVPADDLVRDHPYRRKNVLPPLDWSCFHEGMDADDAILELRDRLNVTKRVMALATLYAGDCDWRVPIALIDAALKPEIALAIGRFLSEVGYAVTGWKEPLHSIGAEKIVVIVLDRPQREEWIHLEPGRVYSRYKSLHTPGNRQRWIPIVASRSGEPEVDLPEFLAGFDKVVCSSELSADDLIKLLVLVTGDRARH